MADFTRRTHVVRIYDTPQVQGQPPSGNYIDVEVLDAIAFRRENGHEAILNFAGGKINPYIIDDTGDNNGKTPDASVATRRSHMKRIASPDGTAFFDVEILDCIAFRDENGMEWIMDFPNPDGTVNEFNVTTGSGDPSATRRVHNEKISGNLKDPNQTQFLTSVRTDAIAFRTVFGREMIISMPSNDDPLSTDPRASTVLTPQGYTPGGTQVTPPKNSDANIYAFVPQGGSFFTDKTPIDMGPLWWIRSVNSGLSYGIIVSLSGTSVAQSSSPPPNPFITGSGWRTADDPNNATILESHTEDDMPGIVIPGADQTIWFGWNNAAPFPDLTTYNITLPVGIPATYIGQFDLIVVNPGSGISFLSPVGFPAYSFSGIFPNEASAQSFVDEFNTAFASSFGHGFFTPTGLNEDIPGPVKSLFAASLFVPGIPASSTETDASFSFQIPSDGSVATLSFTVSVTGNGPTTIGVEGGGPDSGTTGAHNNGSTTYTVTAFVQDPGTPDAEVIVNVTGGSAGGGPSV